MKSKRAPRAYTMGRRGEQVREAGERILAVVYRDFLSRYLDEVTLDEIAAATGVTVQTLLRRWGSKEGLFTAAVALVDRDFADRRVPIEPGDVEAGVRAIVAGYERNGDIVMRALYQEERVAAVQPLVQVGRQRHHEWVSCVFAPWLEARTPRDRTRLHAQLVSVLDIYTWKLMRRDLGLSAVETRTAMLELVRALCGERKGDPS